MPIIADSSQGTTQPIVPIPTKTTTVPTNTVQAIPEASNAINTNQFNFWANIGKIPWVNDKTMAQNPIFQTKEFKEKESLTIEWIKDPIFWESIKNIKSWPYSIDEQVRLIWLAKLQKSKRDSAMSLVWLVGDLLNPSEPIPDDQVDAVYSDLTPEVRNAARWFAADMLNWMPLDEWRKLYPELGKSFFFNKVQDIPYVNQINLDNIKQDISNRTPSDMIPFVEPTFQWNAKDLGRTWFLWWFQEVAKFVGNIPSTILNAAIFGTNFMINPESTGKRVWLLPKSLDLSIRQARADTEWLSMPYRMQHLVNNVADFVTENPDIVAWFELWWLIKKWATRWIWTFMDSIKPIKDVIIDELKAEGISEPTVSQFEAKAQEIYDRQFKKNAETSVDVNVEDGITYTNNRWEVVPAPIINTSQKINDMVFQSLSPTQRWARVKNVRDIQKFAEKMTKWIAAVFLNRDNLPDLFESWMLKKDYSMVDLWQAIEDTGDDVWDTAQWMLDEAELQGTKIPTNLIVNYIDQSIADLTRNWGKVIPWFEWVIKYLNDLKNYVWWDDISIYDAQILSKKLNKLTYWWSQSDNLNKRVAEDVNQILRPSIDNELSNMLGQKWLSNFKAIFWAVRELNELVTKLALKDAKQLPMSFWDRVSQWFTANEMMNAWFSIARWDFVWATMSASKAFMAKVVSNFVKADKDRGLILRKLFNEINSQVWDVKIAWWYWTHLVRKMWAVEEMIRWAKKDKSVKLDYTPEATPMITPEWTIKQTIVTTPKAKWWAMQTDITKPWAIKTLSDNPTDGAITNESTTAGEVWQVESAMKEVSWTQPSPTKSNWPDWWDSWKGNTIEKYLDSWLYDTYEDFDILENIPREDILTLREVNPNITDVEIVKMYEEWKKAMDNAMKNEFTELDMNYAKEIRKLNEEEQRIGTIAWKEINAEATAKQVSDREANRNLVRERMQADYWLDEEAILQKMDELDWKDINEPYKQKSKYVPAAERKIRREERLQKKLDKARRPVGETIKIPEIWLHWTNYKWEIEKWWFKLGNEIKKWEERWYIYMSPSPEGYQASRAWTVQVNLKWGNFDIVDIKDLPIIWDNQIESYWVKKGYDWTVIVRDWKIQEILTTKDYANKNIIKEPSSDVSATKEMTNAEEFVKESNTINPTWKVFTEYTPEKRVKMPLWDNIQTLDKSIWWNADEMIIIYRWGGDKINNGDFITTNKQLAKDYAWSWKVHEIKARKGDIIDNVDEPWMEEYIYRKWADKEPKYTESQLKQIREEENQSRRKDLPTRKDAVRAKNQENMDKYGTNNPEPIDILTYDKNILQKQFNNLINAGDTVSAGKILPELTELIDKVNEIVKAKARQKILDRKKTNPNLPSPPNQ